MCIHFPLYKINNIDVTAVIKFIFYFITSFISSSAMDKFKRYYAMDKLAQKKLPKKTSPTVAV